MYTENLNSTILKLKCDDLHISEIYESNPFMCGHFYNWIFFYEPDYEQKSGFVNGRGSIMAFKVTWWRICNQKGQILNFSNDVAGRVGY